LVQTVLVDAEEELVFLDVDSAEDSQLRQEPGRSRQRWLWLLLAAVLAGGLVVQANRHTGTPAAARITRSTTPSSAGSRIAPTPTTPVTSSRLGLTFLGETGGWTLFGRGPGTLVRIDPASGDITRTVVPQLQSSGPVLFTAVAGEVIIRPIDYVPSYAVPDGRPPQPLPVGFGQGGPILPGPDAGHVWVATGDAQHPAFELSSLDGRLSGTVIRLPAGSSSLEATADGAGYLILSESDGLYRARPERIQRISTGTLLATGRTGWLVAECVQQQHCRQVLIDRTTGQRRILGPENPNGGNRAPWGEISPDGRTAAIFDVGADGHNTIELVDLQTGSIRPSSLDLHDAVNDGTIRWSPDSHWLFAIDVDGVLEILTPATGQVRNLPGSLPPLSQLAIRDGG
jgi:hypothetical protein